MHLLSRVENETRASIRAVATISTTTWKMNKIATHTTITDKTTTKEIRSPLLTTTLPDDITADRIFAFSDRSTVLQLISSTISLAPHFHATDYLFPLHDAKLKRDIERESAEAIEAMSEVRGGDIVDNAVVQDGVVIVKEREGNVIEFDDEAVVLTIVVEAAAVKPKEGATGKITAEDNDDGDDSDIPNGDKKKAAKDEQTLLWNHAI